MKYLALMIGLLLPGCFAFNRELNSQIDLINSRVGQHFFLAKALPVCSRPRVEDRDCVEHADGIVVTGAGSDGKSAYYQVKADDGGAGYIKFDLGADAFRAVDVIAELKEQEAERARRQRADAECRRRGAPRIGMSLAQVRATCWGEPNHVNRTETAGAIRDQLVFGDDRYVYIVNGTVTSIQASGKLQ